MHEIAIYQRIVYELRDYEQILKNSTTPRHLELLQATKQLERSLFLRIRMLEAENK